MRIVQLSHPKHGQRIAFVNDEKLILFDRSWPTTYEFFSALIESGNNVTDAIESSLSALEIEYNQVYRGDSSWKILPPFNHPFPLSCMLSGTGLTHKASAKNRQAMHEKISESAERTDSMKIYLSGEEGGKPQAGKIGVQPEWFFKGNGTHLKAHGEVLNIPPYANDGGEEPEIAGIYLIGKDGTPHRIGFTTANEFSDHVMEKKNYLYLAPSKLRNCAIGPELILNQPFEDIKGEVTIFRNGKSIWSKKISTGEKHMCHSLENLEHHHFKYPQHRIPGMVHIHFFGADAFSFGEGIQLEDGDQMSIKFDGFGRALINKISMARNNDNLVKVKSSYEG